MQILPIDITALVATILGISIVLIPVIGVTARFALKPTAEALARLFEHQGMNETVRVLERRIDFQEQQIEALESSVRRLSEGREFDQKLLAAREKSTQVTGPAGEAQDAGSSGTGPTEPPTGGA